MSVKIVTTYTATIYVGLKNRETGFTHDIMFARAWLASYVLCGLCVTLTPTEFIYSGGSEPGFAVGLINYPRFPSSPEVIREHAISIACGLRVLFQQYKVSIVFPDETVMIMEGE